MQHSKIVTHLSQLTANPPEILYSITMQNTLAAISSRMGEKALYLSAEDFQLAREEVKEAINHNLDIREYIDMGLDSFEIVRKL